MNSLPVKFGVGFSGRAVGIATNPNLKTTLGDVFRCTASGSGWQAYDACATPLTIAASATTTLNLLTGLLNPLGEAIGSAPFAHVFGIMVNHDLASLASSIEAYGGASTNLFQGPWSSTAKATLLPGTTIAFLFDASKTGQVADATHKNIDLKNLDGVHAATVNVFVIGKTT